MLVIPKNASVFNEILNWLSAFVSIKQVHPLSTLTLQINGCKKLKVQDVKIHINFFSLSTADGDYFFMKEDLKVIEVMDESVRLVTNNDEFSILFYTA